MIALAELAEGPGHGVPAVSQFHIVVLAFLTLFQVEVEEHDLYLASLADVYPPDALGPVVVRLRMVGGGDGPGGTCQGTATAGRGTVPEDLEPWGRHGIVGDELDEQLVAERSDGRWNLTTTVSSQEGRCLVASISEERLQHNYLSFHFQNYFYITITLSPSNHSYNSRDPPAETRRR